MSEQSDLCFKNITMVSAWTVSGCVEAGEILACRFFLWFCFNKKNRNSNTYIKYFHDREN